MKKVILFSLTSVLVILSLCAFQCSSTELTSGKLYIQQKNYDKAIEVLKKEVEKNPKSDEGYYELGIAYYELGNYGEMNDSFNKSLAISPKFKENIETYKTTAWGNAYNKGVGYFNKADRVSPDSAKIMFSKAADLFNQAVAIRPDSAAVYRTLAITYVRSDQLDKAVNVLENQLKIKKTSEGISLLGQLELSIGNNFKQAKDTVKAMENYNKAVDVLYEGSKLFPQDSNLLTLLAQAYIDANKTAVAMETFKALTEKSPNSEVNLYNYGVLLLENGKYEQSIEQFKKAVDLKPDYQNAIYNIAVAYVRWGAALTKEAEKNTNINNAGAAEAKDKFKAALPYLQQLIQIDAQDARVWETIAKVYAVLGMTKESEEAFKNADKYRKQ